MNDIFSKIKNDLDTFLQSQQDVIESSNDIISVKKFEARNDLIQRLQLLTEQLPTLVSLANAALSQAKLSHSKELSILDSLTNGKKKKRSYAGIVHGPVNEKPQIIQNPLPIVWTKVKITNTLFLPAIVVNSFDQVKQDGDLYYIEHADHFAIRIYGKLLHGNIGTIYNDEKSPVKIKDCRFAESCSKQHQCDYYHDPMKFSGSKDCRNFIASSFLYAPPNANYRQRPRSRRLGSREHLDVDISSLADEEINRFYDQIMHDILCALLLLNACSGF